MDARRRIPTPARALRAEFGARTLRRAVALAALRLLALAALCALGSSFVIR